MSAETIRAAIRDIPDFPKPGIIFKDITPVLQSAALFAETVEIIAARHLGNPPNLVAGIESRGFIFGAALALRLGCGLVPVRKQGKLPYKTIAASYDLEYGSATIEIHQDALRPGDRVLLVDDLLATGGTAAAAVRLISQLGATIQGIEFVVELAFLDGRRHLAPHPVNAIVAVS
jgi:adenine phosphoribosyltransferase